MSSSIVSPEDIAFLETEKFDFVIVGGGTLGLVVATPLTEVPNVRVLVLEAGSNKLTDPRIMIPGLAAILYDDPEFEWCFMGTPQSGFDAWEKLGNEGWMRETVEPYLRRFHTLTLPSEKAQEDLSLE
ncbi:hypothetical protein LZ554_001036 [Drepanopeziza brunnea f. sp. 'monogermtubi']|nr:hypothetical protein LZ554_001036 [Drepanopeziza brunnea f. sp. 'monogermtubi']